MWARANFSIRALTPTFPPYLRHLQLTSLLSSLPYRSRVKNTVAAHQQAEQQQIQSGLIPEMPLFPEPCHRTDRRKRSQYGLPAFCSIASILVYSANRCQGFSSRRQSAALLHQSSRHVTHASAPAAVRIKSRLFDQRGPSDTRDPLFFAQDMLEQSDTSYSEDENDLTTQSSGGGAFFYAQQSADKTQSGGMDAYEAQFAAMTSQSDYNVRETDAADANQYESWEESQSKAPGEETGNTFTTQTKSVSSQPISSIDARVLESILQEGKLDLNTEEEVKRLLEGPRIVEEKADGTETGNGEYSSKFVSKISDNSFWNSIKAKAGRVLESVQIYLENKIERDIQTLGAVSIFTFERVKRDIGRSLPAAGRQVKKLLLASNSTYAEKLVEATEKTILALPSERSNIDREMDSYEELTTPADEIKQVTEAIRDILAGKELPSSSSASRRRGVRSLAPAGISRMAERQQRAYQARKKTVLQREREGIDRTLGRAIGSVSDATWELRQEMNSGAGREAGYRSKGVRKALAAGAVRMLEAGRESSKRLLGGSNQYPMLEGDVDDDKGAYAKSANVDFDTMQEKEIINLEYAPGGLLCPASFIEEKQRLIASLESCLSQPDQTWLTKEVVSQATENGVTLDGDVLRQVIASMVSLRDELREELVEEDDGERAYLKIDYVKNELRRLKQMVDVITNLAVSAAGENAAILLKTELEGFVLSDTLDETIDIELGRLEQIFAEMVSSRERETQSRKQATYSDGYDQYDISPSVVEIVEQEPFQRRQYARNSSSMYTEVEVEHSPYDHIAYKQDEEQDEFSDEGPISTVEVVSEEEYFEYEQQFKTAQSGDLIDEDAEEVTKEENPAVQFVLRVIDAIFFLGEKFLLVGLPNMISTGSNASSRYSQAQNRGNGYDGWRQLKNLKSKKNQY